MQRNRRNTKLIVFGTITACGVTAGVTSARLFAATLVSSGAPASRAGVSPVSASAPLTEDEKILHVLNRIGYGPRPGDVERVKAMGLDKYIEQQLHPETIDDSAVDTKLSGFKMLSLTGDELSAMFYERNAAAKAVQAVVKTVLKDDPSGAPAMNGGGSAAAGANMAGPMAQPANAANAGAAANFEQAISMATPAEQDRLRQARQLVVAKQTQVLRTDIQLTTAKTLRAVESNRQLQEVMVDFWGNHFNIDTRKGPCATLKVIDDREVIRPHVFGKFRDLLEASAKSPAMLFYLDNFQSTAPQGQFRRRFAPATGANNQQQQQQRGRGGLNENYGREIMELHTLGVDGGYTQKDVTEVARCFTGWGLDRVENTDPDTMAQRPYSIGGQFQFHPYLHDRAQKVVLGHVIPAGGGIEDGEAVLDILASSPATMKHVSFELCQRLVSDTPPASLVDKCVATWQRTDGDIREIVRTIVTSPEFFSRSAYREKLKSPFEFAVSSVRALGGSYDFSPAGLQAMRGQNARRQGYGAQNPNTLVGQVSEMGEPIFEYQAPTGYPEDSHKWRSSGALISRLNFSLALSYGKLPEVELPDMDQKVAGLNAPAQVVDRLAGEILHGDISPATREVILRQTSTAEASGNVTAASSVAASSDVDLMRRMTALMLGSPEFQRR